ncbi:DUF3604 domain-containing protein [Colwellia piezophila]|uniref:DUF3604 domain-containing protein n=1 Tax=Colwellia piezophila TaxID=211668 RepID=UPI0003A19BB6|nr:DUF3604 domain-containing protein [Colwellia piezophila]
MMNKLLLSAVCLAISTGYVNASETNLYWGDTHLHTKLSADAFLMQERTLGPDDAYRYAKGLPVVNALSKHRIKIGTPLDFLMVTDHAEYVGVVEQLFDSKSQISQTPFGKKLSGLIEQGKERAAFFELLATVNSNSPNKDFITEAIRKPIWHDIVDAAERHNDPGKFTSFIGWEWSSLPNGSNLHRIIFMKEGGEIGKKFLPYSSFESNKPEDLWKFLDKTEKETGASFVAIPHNGNISKGKMFAEIDSEGRPLSVQYAKTRMRWEPIYEVTQIKGDSETLSALSPNDEFAEFETYNHALDGKAGGNSHGLPADKGDYARTALMRGLEFDKKLGVNPFKIGLIGASDSHSGVPAVEEDNFGGKFPIDSRPMGKKADLTPGTIGADMSASGLAGVWAKENTRESLMAAFKRREVYGTTGPRIAVRMFAGWDFNNQDSSAKDLAAVGYQKGVPMGGDLTAAPKGKAISLLIRAVKDPVDGNLDRIQVVKGWLDDKGNSHEKVFNVAVSDGRKISNNKVKAVGNTVDIKTASYTNSIGDVELATTWTDPEFDPMVRAFYYVRVLQIPTPRHTLYASVALNEAPQKGYPTSIQERAYSSPIWYTPK